MYCSILSLTCRSICQQNRKTGCQSWSPHHQWIRSWNYCKNNKRMFCSSGVATAAHLWIWYTFPPDLWSHLHANSSKSCWRCARRSQVLRKLSACRGIYTLASFKLTRSGSAVVTAFWIRLSDLAKKLLCATHDNNLTLLVSTDHSWQLMCMSSICY